MFADAYKIASSYTRPLFTLARVAEDPSDDFITDASVGAMVILNEEGWFVTTFHGVQAIENLGKLHKAWQQLQSNLSDIEQGPMRNEGKKKQLIRDAKKKPHSWVSHMDVVYGWPDVKIDTLEGFPNADLAIGHIENFDSARVDHYPDINEPSSGMEIGTSLCRLGYPFVELDIDFDPGKEKFLINGYPPLFPIESIYTRNIIPSQGNQSATPPFDVKFIETSRPGLKGQSGGPIFDTEGTVWGIQSSTQHYPLGFDTKVQHRGKERSTENAFLHVGLGVHSETLTAALDEQGVSYDAI